MYVYEKVVKNKLETFQKMLFKIIKNIKRKSKYKLKLYILRKVDINNYDI